MKLEKGEKMTRLEKEINAVRTVPDVTRLAVKSDPATAAVVEEIYSFFQARLIGHAAMTIAIRSEKDANTRVRISRRAEVEIENITALISK